MNIAATTDHAIREILLTKACRDSGGHRISCPMSPVIAGLEQERIKQERHERNVALYRRAGGCGEPIFSFGGEHWVYCGSMFSDKLQICEECKNGKNRATKE